VSNEQLKVASDQAQASYLELIQQFRDPPESRRNSPSNAATFDEMLGEAEENLLRYPAPYQNAEGEWVPRSKGLITADEVRAEANPELLPFLNTLQMPQAPRVRDDFKIIPARELSDVVQQKQADDAWNRPFVEGLTHDQNGRGSCASEGASGGTVFCEAKQGNELIEKLNGFALYDLVNGGRDGGSSLSDNIAAIQKYGCPSERIFPRSNRFGAEWTDAAKEDALRHRVDEFWRVSNKEEYATALALGMCVYSGYSGHAWYGIDLNATDPVNRLDWHNSWGQDWADNGFSTLRYSSVAWYYGCWTFRTARRAA